MGEKKQPKPQPKHKPKQTYQTAFFPLVISCHAFSAHLPLSAPFSFLCHPVPTAAASLQQAQAMLLLRAVRAHTLQEWWNGLGSFLQAVHTCNIDPHTWSNTESTCALAFFFSPPLNDTSWLKWHCLSISDTWNSCEYRVHIRYQFCQGFCTCEK